jgi:hypothetical protein
MAYYLVRAKPPHNLAALRERLDSGEIGQMRPFGSELQQCLLSARIDDEGWATWEEQCFCSPPLAQERAVLDGHFTGLTTKTINKGEGWQVIEELPSLWDER